MKYKNTFLFALMIMAVILLPACGGSPAPAPASTTITSALPVESPTAITNTPTPVTNTPVPSTDTPAPEPTATPVPSTDTPAPEPTATPVPPTDTPAPEPTATFVPIPAGQGAVVMVNCRGDVLNIDILPVQLSVELAPKTGETCFRSQAIYLDPGYYVLEGSIAGVSSELDSTIPAVPVVAGQIIEIRF